MTELERLLSEYNKLHNQRNNLNTNYLNKGFGDEENKTTLKFFINAFGYIREVDENSDLHDTCIINSVLSDKDSSTINTFKNNEFLRKGVKILNEPCGLENKNVRDSDGRTGFVAPDGTLQIYPNSNVGDYTNCPTSDPEDIKTKFEDTFKERENITSAKGCITITENTLITKIRSKISEILQHLENSSKPDVSDISLGNTINDFKQAHKELGDIDEDVQSLKGIEDVSDIMRKFSFYRIFLWIFIALLGFSFVYSVSKNGGKMSIKSTILISIIIFTMFYMNKHIIKKLFQNLY